MRVTVLCILAFAGATCALQIPSILSPQSARDKGSSILGNIPGINRGDDSSSSSSSSEEDQNPSDIANELAERLVDDVMNAAGGIGSIALLPLNIGTSVFNSVTKEISNVLSKVLHPKNLNPDGPTVPELAVDLTRIVLHDVGKLAGDIGSVLLEPGRIKAQMVQTVSRDINKFLKNVQNQISGDSSEQHRPRPDDRPHHQPQPTNPHHRPTSARPPKPTSSDRSSSTQPPRPTPRGQPSTERPRPTPPKGSSTQRARPTPPKGPSTERARPTPRGQPSTERPRPTPPKGPSTQRARPTPPKGPSTERARPTPPGQPRTERPRPTPPGQPRTERPRPTPPDQPSTERPRPTRPESDRTISKDASVQIRVARDIGLSLSGGISFDQVVSDSKVRNLPKALASVDFSLVVKPVPKIPDLTPLNKLPAQPGLASTTRRARNLVIHAIAAGASTIEEAIQIALSAAIRSVNPAEAIVNLVNIILQIYFFVAQSALGIPPVSTALLKEAAIVAGSLVSSLLAVMSEGVADGVRALLN